jgi:glycosyltransferase involved in cell wall biosynthesis
VRVLAGLLFSPRGGSAHVARALAHELPEHGWDVTVVSGSTGAGLGDAERFYAGLDVRPADFSAGDVPMHPSYEDRPGAPDRCFARVGDEEYRQHVAAWSRVLEGAGAAEADVLWLHHLTPLHEAATRVAPGVPIVGHLHGTELLMLEAIAAGAPTRWGHAEAWARRMRRWARSCERIIVPTHRDVGRTVSVLGIPASVCVAIPNGFDPDLFHPAVADRAAFWRRHLVDRPQGWAPGRPAGSVRYDEAQVAALDGAVVLLYVGRFTAVKRLGLLVRAFERARRRASRSAALVLLGGHPGEWEGEHPLEAIEAAGARDVFLAGWHPHRELAAFLRAADVQVLASVREQFGLVLVEGMACGLPAIAVDRFGPGEIVEDGRTGWLVEPDDEEGLAAAMRAAIEDGEERASRGLAARRAALERWSWPALAGRVSEVLGDAAAVRAQPPAGGSSSSSGSSSAAWTVHRNGPPASSASEIS